MKNPSSFPLQIPLWGYPENNSLKNDRFSDIIQLDASGGKWYNKTGVCWTTQFEEEKSL